MRALLASLVFSLVPLSARAQPPSLDGLLGGAPRVESLPNGLRVVLVPWASPGIVAYYSLVRVGSRDEVEAGHTGFAHFFEHMMFRGTEAHSGDEYAALLNGVGADGNAFTTSDYTCYTLVAPTAALPLVVELESDRFQHLSYAEPAFRTEAGAVRGEYQVWSSDPSQPMWEALGELAFREHTYRHTTIGYLADVEAMPGYYDYSRDFFRRFYTPDDVTVLIVGDFDADAALAVVRERYGSWRGRRARSAVPVEPEPTEGGRRDLTWTGPVSPQMYVGWRTPAFVTEGRGRGAAAARSASLRDTAALQLVYLYAFAESSPLYQRLVVNERQALDLSTGLGEQSRDPGLFLVMAELTEAGSFDGVLAALQAELDAIGRGEVDAARLGTARSHLFGSMVMALETPASVAGFLAGHLAVAPDLDTVRAYLTALAEVGPEDLARVARQYLTASRRFTVTMSPGGAS